jgi:ketosteroid isomerase-like protein
VSNESMLRAVYEAFGRGDIDAVLAFEYHTVHVWRIKDGKFSELWEHPGDPVAFDEAWA